jgi:sulfur relay (sulfurtransferase) complex TusBCD TusD component (DsrE family)
VLEYARSGALGTASLCREEESAMSRYLLIESRDPFETADVTYAYELAANLVKAGNTVTLFLVQNGVLPARKSAKSDALSALAKAGVEVLADEFSLRERGIVAERLATGVKPAPLDVVIDQLAEGRKTLWH